jgi:hypothetical protein
MEINLKPLLLTVGSFTIAFLTMNGTIQNYINFADVINEIAFFGLSTMLGVVGLFATFQKSK